jgi:uncharacterized LabA/DUF88 family protein
MKKTSFNTHRDRNVALLIDAQNLFYAGRCDDDARVNYRELLKGAVDKRVLKVAYAYCAVNPSIKDSQQLFFESLTKMGIYVVKKECTLDKNQKPRKGNLDVEIASDAVELIHSAWVDTIVLVSGDGDFTCLGEKAHKFGKRFEVVSFESSLSKQLRCIADRVVYLDERYLYKK